MQGLTRVAGQPVVDLGDFCGHGLASSGGRLPSPAAFVRRGGHGDSRNVGLRLTSGADLQLGEAGREGLLAGEIGLFGGLQALDLDAVSQPVGEGIADIGLGGQPGLGRGMGRGRGGRTGEGRKGEGQKGECREDQGTTHGLKMGLSRASSKRSCNHGVAGWLSARRTCNPDKEIRMAQSLSGKRVAVLATDGVAQIELTNPVEALNAAGAVTEVVSLKPGAIQGFNGLAPGDMIPVDRVVTEARAGDYDALLLPGGVVNPDHLRVDDGALAFVRAFFEAGKPVAAICHAPWVLINAGVAKGRRMTGYKSIRSDLENPGADVVDEQVVVDDGLITSRFPADMPAFNAKMIEEIAEGRHGHGTATKAA